MSKICLDGGSNNRQADFTVANLNEFRAYKEVAYMQQPTKPLDRPLPTRSSLDPDYLNYK
jgi:hypothetical protein